MPFHTFSDTLFRGEAITGSPFRGERIPDSFTSVTGLGIVSLALTGIQTGLELGTALGFASVDIPVVPKFVGSGSFLPTLAAMAAKRRAQIHERNAQIARDLARFKAEQIRIDNKRGLSRIRTRLLAGGTTLVGSGTDVLFDRAVQGELAALFEIHKGEIGAINDEAQADAARFEEFTQLRRAEIQRVREIPGMPSSSLSTGSSILSTLLTSAGQTLSLLANPLVIRIEK